MDQLQYFELNNGERYPYAVTINVMSAIQKKYGSFEEAMSLLDKNKQKEVNLEVLIDFYYESINEGIDIFNETKKDEDKISTITVRQAGRIISELGFNSAQDKAKKAVINVAPNNEHEYLNDGEEIKN